MYKIETGEVFAFDPASGQFLPVSEQSLPVAPAARLTTPTI